MKQLSQLSHSYELLEHEQGTKRLTMARLNSAVVDITEWKEAAEGSITGAMCSMRDVLALIVACDKSNCLIENSPLAFVLQTCVAVQSSQKGR